MCFLLVYAVNEEFTILFLLHLSFLIFGVTLIYDISLIS